MADDLLGSELNREVIWRLGVDDLSDMVNEFKNEFKAVDTLTFQLKTGCTHEIHYIKSSDGIDMRVCIECDIAEEMIRDGNGQRPRIPSTPSPGCGRSIKMHAPIVPRMVMGLSKTNSTGPR